MLRYELTLPELEMGEVPITLSVWLVEPGDEVVEGDRVVEVLAGAATVDLPSPVTGRLVEQLVLEDEPLAAGQVLGVFEATGAPP